MTDLLTRAAIERARAALNIAAGQDKAGDFAALVAARLAATVQSEDAAAILEARGKTTLIPVLKAAVDAGSASATTWAGQLAGYDGLSAGFIESMCGLSLYDSIAAASLRLPTRTRVASVTQGMVAAKTDELSEAPATALALAAGNMEPRRISGIAMFSNEIARAEGAEQFILSEIRRAIATGTDVDFLSVATDDAPEVPSSGPTADALMDDLALATTELRLHAGSRLYLGVSPAVCAAWALLGSVAPAFAGLSVTGGEIQGITVVPTDAIGNTTAVLVDAAAFVTASDDVVGVRVSRDAMIDMRDAFANGDQKMVSAFQADMVAAIASRWYSFHQAREDAVAVLTGVTLPTAGV
jgi:hypothetical protein